MRIRPVVFYCLLILISPGHSWGWPWTTDMFSQPSHKAQEDKALEIPAGTAPTHRRPILIKDKAQSDEVSNPILLNKESLERGKWLYDTYCAVCHGEKGVGDGVVGKKYVPPTDLTSEYVQKKSDGNIYYTITYGGLAIMPHYRDSILPEDRWHIVNYIKYGLGK